MNGESCSQPKGTTHCFERYSVLSIVGGCTQKFFKSVDDRMTFKVILEECQPHHPVPSSPGALLGPWLINFSTAQAPPWTLSWSTPGSPGGPFTAASCGTITTLLRTQEMMRMSVTGMGFWGFWWLFESDFQNDRSVQEWFWIVVSET